ncbi:hypothetical protein P168DRAFT_284865 [Aspergillus campestris IBT 28561]|uniref:CoA-dependent acyltransferase n=1 Tax=Aspergillus campestris (strain IBT 28561) TaxID=1392248 RepID=A0A2I1CSU2_ASPC2|nr:uncharacterized protein P168DRAFT_284865 [Aspergillus campestris IBT 28561]PKY00692.1 hypothetical protein P168DRAFT_284865 [Aspergillus campestris IBT 28561]
MERRWTEVSPGRWERPTSGMEGYFCVTGETTASACDGREHYSIFSTLTLELDYVDVEPALRHAWKQMRYEQPQIATTAEGTNFVYEVPDETALSHWLGLTFVVSDAGGSDELYLQGTPFRQSTLYWLPRSSELVFRAHHQNIDGTGVLLFWHRYLGALTSPTQPIDFGDEPARLAPVMEDILGLESQSSKKDEKALGVLSEYINNVPGIGHTSRVGSAPSGRSRTADLTFSMAKTDRIVRACQAHGVTVTSALHAAYIQALTKHADPNSQTTRYVSANQFNLRPYLPEPYSTDRYGVAVYYATHPFTIALPSTFWETAHALHHYYSTSYKGNRPLLELNGHITRALCNIVQTPEYLAAPVPTDALVSSLGIAERYLQREYGKGVVVKNLAVGVEVVLRMSMIFFYTFRDQLRLRYCFNEGFENMTDVGLYLQEMEMVLDQELLS